jgi:hypothetical protein
MPRSAIGTGIVDLVLPPEKMSEALLSLARHPYVRQPTTAVEETEPDEQLRALMTLVRAQTRRDFNSYKKRTLLRRIQRRVGLHRIDSLRHIPRGCATIRGQGAGGRSYDQRHRLLSGPRGLAGAGGLGHRAARAGSPAGFADPGLDSGMLDRRGGLHDAVIGARRAVSLEHRHRRGREAPRALFRDAGRHLLNQKAAGARRSSLRRRACCRTRHSRAST